MALYTIGYAASDSQQELTRLMADPQMLLIDIRLVPSSRWHLAWRKAALSAQCASRYLHLPGLGNLHYKHPEKGIELASPEMPLQHLRQLLESGHSLVLLCACAQYQQCHRRTVYDLLNSPSCAPQ